MKTTPAMTAPMTARPPTIPPAIAPTGVFFCDEFLPIEFEWPGELLAEDEDGFELLGEESSSIVVTDWNALPAPAEAV
jgi:hypothetical protein